MVNHFTFHDTRLLLISKATSSFGLHQTNVWTCTIYKLVDLLLCLSSYEDLLYEDCCWVGRIRITSIFQIALFYASHLINISFESRITRMSISKNDFSILTTNLHLWVTNEILIFYVYQSEGLISWEKRPHHHSQFSSTSSIIEVPPMHNVEAPPALFIQFHKKNWMNLPIFLHNGGTHTPHFQILRFEWCRFFWLLLLLGRSLRNKLLVPLASEQKWAKLERLHVTSKSWLYVRVTVENYANKLNYSSAYYQLSLTPMRLDGGKQKYAYHGKCMLCYIHRCN